MLAPSSTTNWPITFVTKQSYEAVLKLRTRTRPRAVDPAMRNPPSLPRGILRLEADGSRPGWDICLSEPSALMHNIDKHTVELAKSRIRLPFTV
jgi:hypothetical protein